MVWQFWLLGYEFPATLFLFTLEGLYIVTTVKKAKHLEPLKGGKVPLHVLVRGKDAEANNKLFLEINDHIKAAGVSHQSANIGLAQILMSGAFRRKLAF